MTKNKSAKAKPSKLGDVLVRSEVAPFEKKDCFGGKKEIITEEAKMYKVEIFQFWSEQSVLILTSQGATGEIFEGAP